MKRLCLLRHAKSSWNLPDLCDKNRPLSARGIQDAPRVGQMLSRRMTPLMFYVSPAVRALQTFSGVLEGWSDLSCEHCQVEPALYTFESAHLIDWLTLYEANSDSLALIGHNPALTNLVHHLAGKSSLHNLPTAGWIELLLPIEHWSAIAFIEGQGVIDFRTFPREL